MREVRDNIQFLVEIGQSPSLRSRLTAEKLTSAHASRFGFSSLLSGLVIVFCCAHVINSAQAGEGRELDIKALSQIVKSISDRPDPPALEETNPLSNLPIRYLIGAEDPGEGQEGAVTVVAYDEEQPLAHGISVAYCNLFDETNSGNYGPYLNSSATAVQYKEGQIDPRGPGWEKNLREQFGRRRAQGFEFVDIDNPDSYEIEDVIRAIDLAEAYGLKVIAKNPGLMKRGALAFISHPNVYGIVVEEDAGTPKSMDELRKAARKPDLPIWFIAYGSGKAWAETMSTEALRFPGVGVTYSSSGEYTNVIDFVTPSDRIRVAAR